VRAGGRFSQMDSFENDFPALPNAGHGSFNANDFQPHSDDFPALPGPQSFKGTMLGGRKVLILKEKKNTDDLGFLGSASSQQQQQNNYYQSSKNTFGGSNSDLDSMSKLRISDGPLQKVLLSQTETIYLKILFLKNKRRRQPGLLARPQWALPSDLACLSDPLQSEGPSDRLQSVHQSDLERCWAEGLSDTASWVSSTSSAWPSQTCQLSPSGQT